MSGSYRGMMIHLVCASICLGATAMAHDGHGHRGPTYEVTSSVAPSARKILRLEIRDADTGEFTSARFTLQVDGKTFVPPELSQHGLRFVSIHQGKKQRFVSTYARGSGPVDIALVDGARDLEITVVKGLDFLPASQRKLNLQDGTHTVTVNVRRWRKADHWFAADAHIHYERLQQQHDSDWLDMLAADGLSHAHFMVLRGGNLPGVWAQQYAYGAAGEAQRNTSWIRSGEEYRDSSQGHINLFGLNAVIPPMSTGGIGQPRVTQNYPPLLEVLQRTRQLGGIGGPAHGGSLARSSTAALDTILGGVAFIEIANTHLYKTDVWYQLMNCGFSLAPMAGTDLPNFPFRDPWQPFLGEIRTYVKLPETQDFAAWKQAVAQRATMVSSGPFIDFEIQGVGPGGTVQLSGANPEIQLSATIYSPRDLHSFEIVRNGQVLPSQVLKSQQGDLHVWKIKMNVPIAESCWFAARGAGPLKFALQQNAKIQQRTLAHTAAIQVIVDQRPIRVQADIDTLTKQLLAQQEYYRTRASYENNQQRQRFLSLFDDALRRLDNRDR